MIYTLTEKIAKFDHYFTCFKTSTFMCYIFYYGFCSKLIRYMHFVGNITDTAYFEQIM